MTLNEKRQLSKHPILSGVVKMLLTYIGTYGLSYVCLIVGLFWGAIYLRTGSILITVVFHFLYDVLTEMLVLPDPIRASNLIFMFVVQLLPLVLTFVLMRRSKTEDIKATWANIWSE